MKIYWRINFLNPFCRYEEWKDLFFLNWGEAHKKAKEIIFFTYKDRKDILKELLENWEKQNPNQNCGEDDLYYIIKIEKD